MEREILFRGLSINAKNKGEFVYGIPFENEHGDWQMIVKNERNYSIEKTTIGQFTGLSDKNGTKIFEGDKVKYFNPYSKEWYEHIVLFDKQWACFGLFEQGNQWCKESDWVKIQELEVIGNIHQTK